VDGPVIDNDRGDERDARTVEVSPLCRLGFGVDHLDRDPRDTSISRGGGREVP
jgi:hypothetical protein